MALRNALILSVRAELAKRGQSKDATPAIQVSTR
jgi:hypothetical protein